MFLWPGVCDITLSLYGHLPAYAVYFCIVFIFSCIFILSRESDHCAIRARLGVASHLPTTPRRDNPVKSLFQLHNS